jgi:hypothetical protein
MESLGAATICDRYGYRKGHAVGDVAAWPKHGWAEEGIDFKTPPGQAAPPIIPSLQWQLSEPQISGSIGLVQ